MHLGHSGRNVATIGASHGEQLVDQSGKPIGLLQHALDHFAICRRITWTSQADLAYAANGCQRGPELMGDVPGKAAHLEKRRLEPPQRVVEHRRHATKLVLGCIDGQPLVET